MCVDVENVSALLLHRVAPYIAHLIQENDFTNAGASRLLTSLQPQVSDRAYCYLYPEEYCMDTVEVMDSGSEEGAQYVDQDNDQDEDEVDEELDARMIRYKR